MKTKQKLLILVTLIVICFIGLIRINNKNIVKSVRSERELMTYFKSSGRGSFNTIERLLTLPFSMLIDDYYYKGYYERDYYLEDGINYGIKNEAKAKNTYSNRKIIISQACIDLLKEYKAWQDDYKKKIGKMWKNENRIFTSKYGTHIHPDTCTDIFCQIIKKYNLPKITFHELRHTCTSLLVDNGVNIKAVSLRLGHSNTNTTMNIYTHAYEASKQQSADMFDKILKSI